MAQRSRYPCQDAGVEAVDQRSAGIVMMADPQVSAIPVRECGEELVDTRDCAALLLSSFRADDLGLFARVRLGVLDRLATASQELPAGLRLLIVECYRPPVLQRRYFDRYLDAVRAANPDWDAQRLRVAASRYVSPPELAPHSAGAAVDLTLCTDDGAELDLGTQVNATPEESGGRCYTDSPGLDGQARHNRAVLSAALRGAGFINYPTEWWHWSYGDRYWAMVTGAEAAIYGPREL
jgi:D-alanyl-D-alanine dipeptidase